MIRFAVAIALLIALVSYQPKADPAQAFTNQFERWVAVTKSDATQYGPYATTASQAIDALYIGGTGDVALKGIDDVVVTFTGVPVGTVLRVSPKSVMSTNTAASGIVALYR